MTRATRLNRDVVTGAALDLLDEVGLDAVSTRRLAQRLGVEQPSLYWHFRDKSQLLAAMAEAAMAPHAAAPLPGPDDEPLAWFRENARSLRRTLLRRRDGARLHAGSRPAGDDLGRITHKLTFLTTHGLPEPVARMALLAAGRFTVGSVLEEQADLASGAAGSGPEEAVAPAVDHDAAFEAGLGLLTDGLGRHLAPRSTA